MSEKEQIKFMTERIIGKTNEELAKVCLYMLKKKG